MSRNQSVTVVRDDGGDEDVLWIASDGTDE
jgi:hypothetical protein